MKKTAADNTRPATPGLPAPLTLALPKGRLSDQVRNYFEERGLAFRFNDRELVAFDREKSLKIFLVKNSDLPTYVNHGIAGLGICGDDVLTETGHSFYRLMTFPFGGTAMCLAGKKGDALEYTARNLTVASKFPVFTRNFFNGRGLPVEIIKLSGSVELAPVLGLSRYIVDLVETGGTLRANNLEVLDRLGEIKVRLIANPAYYKIHFKKINQIVDRLKGEGI